MPSYEAHLRQALSNLEFLEQLNQFQPQRWDWQVTVCFYTAVHLANAYLADKERQHYQTHGQRDQALNHYGHGRFKWPENEYLAYENLSGLSRRARYLCSEADDRGRPDVRRQTFLTHEKHLLEALTELDLILTHFENEYNRDLPTLHLHCAGLNARGLTHFEEATSPGA